MPAARRFGHHARKAETPRLLESLLEAELSAGAPPSIPRAISMRPVPTGRRAAPDRADALLWRAALVVGGAGLLLIGLWLLNGPVYDLLFAPPPARPTHRTQVAAPATSPGEVRRTSVPPTRLPEPAGAQRASAQIDAPARQPRRQAQQEAWMEAQTREPVAPPTASLAEGLALAASAATALPPPEPTPLDELPQPIWITIPAIQVDSPVIQVWIENDAWLPIDYAAGYIRGTGDLGRQGNVVIAGHAGLRGGVFIGLPRLKAGDEVFLETPYIRYRYVVRDQRIVWPNQIEVFYATPTSTLTLIACANWDTQRLVITADYVDLVPLAPPGEG